MALVVPACLAVGTDQGRHPAICAQLARQLHLLFRRGAGIGGVRELDEQPSPVPSVDPGDDYLVALAAREPEPASDT